MYQKISDWLDDVLDQSISEDVIAFAFNLYEDEDNYWSVELVGTGSFDAEDEDWCCDEISDFGTRDEPFTWQQKTVWSEILGDVTTYLREYLEKGNYADVLKSRTGVGVGFVDGDIEIIYTK